MLSLYLRPKPKFDSLGAMVVDYSVTEQELIECALDQNLLYRVQSGFRGDKAFYWKDDVKTPNAGSFQQSFLFLGFDRTVKTSEALEEMADLKVRPATLRELIFFLLKNPVIHGNLIALGTSALSRGARLSPFLCEWPNRVLTWQFEDGGWRGGSDDSRFLAASLD